MKYTKPQILAQSFLLMAECRPNSKPSGRPCNPPTPGGRERRNPINNNCEKGDESKEEKIKEVVTDFITEITKIIKGVS